MIAQANLETKRKALAERASKLAFEKIACFERIDAIGRSLEQIDLLTKVMDVTLADMAVDDKEVLDAVTRLTDEIDKLAQHLESKGNDEGEPVTRPG